MVRINQYGRCYICNAFRPDEAYCFASASVNDHSREELILRRMTREE